MSSLNQPKPILPWWQLGLLIVGCALGVWWLLPDDSQLIEDLIRDGSNKKAAQRLRDISAEEKASKPDYYRSLEVRLSRLGLPRNASTNQLTHWWRTATNAWKETSYSSAVFNELTPIITKLPDPKAAWNIAKEPDETLIPPDQLRKLARLLSNAALAANQPHTSATLYALGHPETNRTQKETIELTRRWQLAGDASQALLVLGDIESAEVIPLRISLLRALNRNEEAVALIRSHIAEMGEDGITAEYVELLAASALAAGIPEEAIPNFRIFADRHPDDLEIQRRLRTLLVAAGKTEEAFGLTQKIARLSNHAPEELLALAQLAEYSGNPTEAFNNWLKLADLTSEPDAIDRLIELNKGLYRDRELARVLVNIVPMDDHPEYTLTTARLLMELGRYYEAEKYFELHLNEMPQDLGAAKDLADLHYELFEYPQAEKWFRYASKLDPTDLKLGIAVANAVMMQNRPDDALSIYREIMAEHPTEEVIAQYVRIAESLGRYDELSIGLREQIRRREKPSLQDYIRLSYTFARMNEVAPREKILREGLQHFPDNSMLRISLAQLLSDRKEYKSAQEVLARSARLHHELPAALLFLDLMRLNNDLESERQFLATPFAADIRNNEDLLEREARAYEALQDYPNAAKIRRILLADSPDDHERVGNLARVMMLQGAESEARNILAPFLVKPSPDILELAAEISLASGDYLNAEKYQIEYLGALEEPRETDWGMLGDIRLSRGDPEGAVRAYQTANRLMIARLLLPGETGISKQTLIRRADTFSLDDRHYLLYLNARVHDAQTAKGLAEKILANNPSDRQTLLVLASMALEKRDARETLRLARIYLSYYPDDYQGLYFLGTGHFLAKEYHRANAVLRDLKHSQFPNRLFPFETDLAASALASGDWYRAMLSYQELLRHHVLSDDLRSEVRYVLDGIYREHGRRVEFTSSGTRLNLSQVRRYTALHAAHISNRHWLDVIYKRDDIHLKAAPGLQKASRSRNQIAAKLTRFISTRWIGDLSLGSYGDGLLGSASLRYLFAQQREVSLEQTFNERATDSLGLEALDGRESRTSLNLRWLLEADLTANLRLHTRSITIGGDNLGQSSGADLNVDYVFRRHGPHLSGGYRGSHARFSPETVTANLPRHAAPIADPRGGQIGREAVIRNLLSRHLNRHGAGLYLTDNIADAWVYRLTLGSDYDFELSSLGWNGSFSLSFYPRKSIELSAETGYTSSATDSNAGNAATLTNFLFRFYY